MFPCLLVLLLALLTTAACTEPPPPSVPKRTITWSTVSPTMATTTTSSTSPFTEGKPCELLSRDEAAKFGLNPPGLEDEAPNIGPGCTLTGKDFSTIIAIGKSVSLAQVEAGRPGRRISIGGRAASLASSENKEGFEGLCDIAIDVNGSAHARVVVSHHDKNTQAACIKAAAIALLIERRLPDG